MGFSKGEALDLVRFCQQKSRSANGELIERGAPKKGKRKKKEASYSLLYIPKGERWVTCRGGKGEIAQLVRVLVCHARSRGFEPRFPRSSCPTGC